MTPDVRPATEADLDAVAAIYAREVREGYATFDTEVPPRTRWSAKLASTHPGDHFLVAVDGERVVGFAYSGPYRERGAYTHTRESTIYLDPSAAGRGLGRTLYGELVARVTASGARTLLAAIALPNDASEGLHRAYGFERLGVMREVGRKLDRWIDVAWWQLLIDDHGDRSSVAR
ncbi:phosphinothricin acetyltransferase [Nocardioides thalensis]|uniref:Phosphinothricin acetyltransferase n=1 Tax=Nocardioides thalensis TaxID=1914755 RepID=A0A853C6U5_9ACTN|nr:phosphinothricin acetyltransferase [Nocardioides thalensis]